MTPNSLLVVLSILLSNLMMQCSSNLICTFEEETEETIICTRPGNGFQSLNSDIKIHGLNREVRPTEMKIRARDCKLVSIRRDFFESLKLTKQLDLSMNIIDELEDNTFSYLRELRVLNLSNNIIVSITPEVFHPLSKLKVLDLSMNYLVELTTMTFAYLNNLKFLDLSDNPDLMNIDIIKQLNLKSLKIAKSSLRLFERYSFNMNDAVHLDLSHNTFLLTDGYAEYTLLEQCPKLVSFRMSNCSVRVIDKNLFVNLGFLAIVDLSHNNISYLSIYQFSTNTELAHLDLSHNKITSLSGKLFDRNIQIYSLNLKENELMSLPVNIFEQLTELGMLDLSDNKLEVLSSQTFAKNTKMNTLHLDNNRINILPRLLFANLNVLQELTLSNNFIESINIIFPYKNLVTLRLDNNMLTEIPNSLISDHNRLKALNLSCNMFVYMEPPITTFGILKVQIQGNPWNCACLNSLLARRVKDFVDEWSKDGEHPSCVVGKSKRCDQNIEPQGLKVWMDELSYYPEICRPRN